MELTMPSENPTPFRTLLQKVKFTSFPAELPILIEAYAILTTDSHLRCHAGVLRMHFKDESLVITGRLPSFFLKQMVQERLRALQVPIVNEIGVLPR